VKERIAEFIRDQAYKPMTYDELVVAMEISEKQHVQLRKTLEQMEATGEVVRTRLERYGAPDRMNLAVGRLQGHPKGFGFLVSDTPGEEDIYIGRESLKGAWHGDRIIARLTPPTRPGGRNEGEVIRILQRGTQRVVGTYETAKHTGFVTPDDRRLPEDISIPKGATNGAKSGEKVVVQIVTYPEARRSAEGKVVERLGMKGDVGVDIVSVIRKFALPEAFPGKVLSEAEATPETVQEDAIGGEGRRDLRDWTIVTIDGEDAKDLDDAVNVERIGEGRWRLGVHIADVSYYVREGSALDQDAYRRATSVYLADRVVPMLPPRLSNGICSLNPHVDRLTLSCVMEINDEGKVLSYEIFQSVIKTVARMTYTKVNEILAGDSEAMDQYQSLVSMFHEMNTLMHVLKGKRELRGALDFELPEAKVKLNEVGWPIEIRRVERGLGERIIEEFMLAANETVAEHCCRLGVPFMYRVHGEPANDRLAGLRDFLGLFGYVLRLPQGVVPPKALQAILAWTKGRPEENLINSVILRTMRQAVYSEENRGHFGLAADYYCHFTSPIRRYPDLVVHRVLRALMTPGQIGRQRAKWERWMPEAARHSSDQERVAMEAERETIELKKAEFMSDKVGETFAAIVSGVGQFGFFVQLPNTVEGLVHVSTLTDDYYHFHENFYALIGERTRRRFRLGDAVVVKLSRVDIDNRQLDFMLDVADSPVVTVVTVPGETRNRAAKKRVLSGEPLEQPVVATTGRRRKRRKSNNERKDEGMGHTLSATHMEAVEQTVIEDERLPFRLIKGKPGLGVPAPLGIPASRRVEAPVEVPEPEEAPRAPVRQAMRKPLPELTETSGPRPDSTPPGYKSDQSRDLPRMRRLALEGGPRRRTDRPEGEELGRPARSDRPSGRTIERPLIRGKVVDMWGLPVPEGRLNRPRTEDDPGVINPFSLTASRNEGRRRPPQEALSLPGPASGSANSASGLPPLGEVGAARRAGGQSRGRRPRRPGARPRAQQPQE
jgi:ribonuclease R